MTLLRNLLAILLTGSALVVAQRSVDVRVDRDPGLTNSLHPRIAAADGVCYAVWEDRRSSIGDVYFNRSVDGARTWMANDVQLNTGGPIALDGVECPQVVAEGATVVAVWEDHRNGQSDIYVNTSADHGQTWLPASIRIDTGDPAGATQSLVPSIAIENGTVLVAWRDSRFRIPGFATSVYANRSVDGGATWLPAAVRVEGSGGNGFADALRVTLSGGTAYAVWQDNRAVNTVQNIYFNRSLDGGATWAANDTRLDTSFPAGTVIARDPQIAVSGSDIFVTWTDFRNLATTGRDIYFTSSTDSGVSWVGDSPLTVRPGDQESSAIAAAGNNVYVAWWNYQPPSHGASEIFVQRSLNRGAAWLPIELQVDVGLATQSLPPRIVADGDTVVVAWIENLGRLTPMVNRSTDAGGTWLSSALRMNTGVFSSSCWDVDCALDAATCYVVWRDGRGGATANDDIYSNVAFGAQSYGTGLAGGGAITPSIRCDGYPMLGATIQVELTEGLGGAAAAIFLSFQGGASVGVLGGTLLVASPILSVSLTLSGASGAPGQGSATLPLSLPTDPALHNLRVNLQGFVADPAAPFGISMTGGLEIWIC